MEFIDEPGIILDVLEYNMVYLNQNLIQFRDELIYGDTQTSKLSLYYYNQFRTGKFKFDPLAHWYPLFRYRSDNYNFFPLFRFFWDSFDFVSGTAESFFSQLTTEQFKRCFFEFYLASYSSKVNIDSIIEGDLYNSLNALALLVKDGEKAEDCVRYLCDFNAVIEEIIPYLMACYEKIKDFHMHIVPKIMKNVTDVFNDSEPELRRMNNISDAVSVQDQMYTVCLIEHTTIFCKALSADSLLFFAGANGKVSLQQWGETLGFDMFSFSREMGNEVKYGIIQELRRGERTVTQLSRVLFISRSTVDRCVSMLHEAHIVTFTKKLGTERYLKLNQKYFLAAKARLSLEINAILDDIASGSSSI